MFYEKPVLRKTIIYMWSNRKFVRQKEFQGHVFGQTITMGVKGIWLFLTCMRWALEQIGLSQNNLLTFKSSLIAMILR